VQLATAPLTVSQLRSVLPQRHACGDTGHLRLRYFRLDRDGRFIIGGPGWLTPPRSGNAISFRVLEASARRMFPRAGGHAVRARWAARDTLTPDLVPHLYASLPPGCSPRSATTDAGLRHRHGARQRAGAPRRRASRRAQLPYFRTTALSSLPLVSAGGGEVLLSGWPAEGETRRRRLVDRLVRRPSPCDVRPTTTVSARAYCFPVTEGGLTSTMVAMPPPMASPAP
jgi:hypothetical protein